MMDLATIREMNRKATRAAKRGGKRPAVPTAAQRTVLALGEQPRGFSIPFLADHTPRGWEAVGEAVMVDTSGFGSPSEPALTLANTFKRIAAAPADHGWATVEHGQFQAYLQEYRPVE